MQIKTKDGHHKYTRHYGATTDGHIVPEICDPRINTGFRTSYRPRIDLDVPAHKLLYACLLDGVRRYQNRPNEESPPRYDRFTQKRWKRRHEEADEAEVWIFVADETDYIFSFLFICDQLDLDVGLVREAIRSGQFDASYDLPPSRTRTVPLRPRVRTRRMIS